MLRSGMLAKDSSEWVERISRVIRGGAGKAGGFASELQGDVGGWIGAFRTWGTVGLMN